jgi:acyl carrier protein
VTTPPSTVAVPLAGDVLAAVCGAIATVLERAAATLTAEDNLRELGIDSLGLVATAEIVEEHFAAQSVQLRIPDEDLDRFVTVADVVRFVQQQLVAERRV